MRKWLLRLFNINERICQRLSEEEELRIVTHVVRKADGTFEKVGGSSRHWVRECFLPELDEAGLMIVRKP